MSSPFINFSSNNGISTITFNRPAQRNAINREMADELAAFWEDFEAGDDRVVLITGSEGVFTAGADITNPPRDSVWIPNMGPVVSKPVIAAIDGWCVGAGVMLLQHVDLAIVTDRARFQYPEARVGVSRGLATGLSVRTPHKLAMEVLLMGRVLDAEFMFRAGLCNAVVSPDDLDSTAQDWAATIASADPDVTRFLKKGVMDLLPRSAGEIGVRQRWEADSLPGNRRFIEGGLDMNELKQTRTTKH